MNKKVEKNVENKDEWSVFRGEQALAGGPIETAPKGRDLKSMVEAGLRVIISGKQITKKAVRINTEKG